MAGEGSGRSLAEKLSGLFSGGRKKEEPAKPEKPLRGSIAADEEDLFSPVGETGTGFNFVLREPQEEREEKDPMDDEEDDPDRTRKYDPIRMH